MAKIGRILRLCLAWLVLLAALNAFPAASQDIEDLAAEGAWTCYDDGSLDPCHNTLHSVDFLSSSSGWAVGMASTIFRWNGSAWIKTPAPSKGSLFAVDALSETDAWAVGTGLVLQWNGVEWSLVTAPTSQTLKDVHALGVNDVWVMSNNGFYWWNGTVWSPSASPVANLNDFHMFTDTDGWAVGRQGKILRRSGNQWTEYAHSLTTADLNNISFASATEGWITGWNGVALHWNGVDWQLTSGSFSDIATLGDVDAVSPTEAWMVGFDNGANTIYRWNGTTWITSQSNSEAVEYTDVRAVPGGTDVWAVGSGGTILRWNGSAWLEVNKPYIKPLLGVDFLSPSQGWAAGCAYPVAQGDTYRWNGATWHKGSPICAYHLMFESDTRGYAVGDGIWMWSGGTDWVFQGDPLPNSMFIESFDLTSPGEGWAVGGGFNVSQLKETGAILRISAGSWSVVTSSLNTELYAVDMLSASLGWAVGQAGTILQYQGSGWTPIPSPTGQSLYDVQMLSASDGWAVGSGGTILRWNGASWSLFTSPTTLSLSDVYLRSATDGWAVGSGGVILRWNGVNWHGVNSPTTVGLSEIAAASSTELWAVGGTILHYRYPDVSLVSSNSTGAPGSYFRLSGSGFAPNVVANIFVNGVLIGTIPTNDQGALGFWLSTSLADEGDYWVTVQAVQSATLLITLKAGETVHPKDGIGPVLAVPAGISVSQYLFMPLVRR